MDIVTKRSAHSRYLQLPGEEPKNKSIGRSKVEQIVKVKVGYEKGKWCK